MKKRILSKIIKNLTDVELYAFVSATILEMSRRSGEDTDGILTAIRNLITEIEVMRNDEHKDR